jgi:soluble lytic murein transglycosylase-like protein
MTDPQPPDPPAPDDRGIVDRYLGRLTPAGMSRQTAMIRQALRAEHHRHRARWVMALASVVLLGAAAGGWGWVQHRRVERARAAGEELFYAMKGLELQVAQLRLTVEERAAYRTQQDDLARRYRDYLERLGIYSSATPAEVQLVYRVIHRLGESELNVPTEFVQEVRRYIQRWMRNDRLRDALARAAAEGYGPKVADALLQHDLPPEFFFLALQESNFKTEAVGPSTRFGIAKGMWQMLPGTAMEYGLQTGPLVGQRRPDPADERHDFERSTTAAAQYLRDIYRTDAQASGLLVIASYNWGQTRVLRLIRSLPESPRERNYWRLLTQYRDRIPQETYDYVLSVVSAAVIAERPEYFGFTFASPLPADTAVWAAPAGT